MGITKTQMGVGGASRMEFLSDCFFKNRSIPRYFKAICKKRGCLPPLERLLRILNQASTFNNNGPKLAKLPN